METTLHYITPSSSLASTYISLLLSIIVSTKTGGEPHDANANAARIARAALLRYTNAGRQGVVIGRLRH